MSPPREDTTLGVVGKPVESAEDASVRIGVSSPGVDLKADRGCRRLNVDESVDGKDGFCLLEDANAGA